MSEHQIKYMVISVDSKNDGRSNVTVNQQHWIICDCSPFTYRKSFFICGHIKYVQRLMASVPFNGGISEYFKQLCPPDGSTDDITSSPNTGDNVVPLLTIQNEFHS